MTRFDFAHRDIVMLELWLLAMEERIEKALDRIRPYLRADGGDVKFKQFRPDGILELTWEGTCLICPMSVLTLRAGV
ncbi:MAG: nitrogen-fixing NifU domain protein, partial [Bacteroidetes bacterium]|nr:nitrogen-fixing NifU domain protein [Bacteroidota bacterium]